MSRAERSGQSVTAGRLLAKGGQGEVLTVREDAALVFKRYLPGHATADTLEKLRVMTENPPTDPTEGIGHRSIAWPLDVVLTTHGNFEGFLMPLVDLSATPPLATWYNPAGRNRAVPTATWEYLLRLATNLASAVNHIHQAEYVIGDLNESNVLGTEKALITIVDCDSAQVRNPENGRVFHCPVAKPDYLAPELQGADLSSVDRLASADNFSLAVLIYLLLMEGFHPFQGVWKRNGEPPDISERIRGGLFPPVKGSVVAHPPAALPFDTLKPEVQTLFVEAFGDGINDPDARPTAADWLDTLETVEQSLTTCSVRATHVYSGHLSSCPWCRRVRQGLPDPYPGRRTQRALPPVVPPKLWSVLTRPGSPPTAPGASRFHPTRLLLIVLGALLIGSVYLLVIKDDPPPRDPPLSLEAFLKGANAICKQGDTQLAEAGTQILKDLTATNDQWVRFYLEQTIPIARYKITAIGKLNPPAKEKDKVQRMLVAWTNAVNAVDGGLRNQAVAYLSAKGPDPFREFETAARKLKLTECAPIA